jgi:pimeloyl-ACP methyl ester carboxylesterase
LIRLRSLAGVCSCAVIVSLTASAAPAATPVPAMSAYVDGAGSPLIMLGGGARGAASLEPFVKPLGLAHRVVRLQSLNNAYADRGLTLPRDYSIRLETRAMERALDSLRLTGPVDVVGLSQGALIALDFALQHPRRVRSLTLDEPPAFWIMGEEAKRDSAMNAMISLTRQFRPDAEITDDQAIAFHCLLGGCAQGRPTRDDPRWTEWTRRKSALRGLSAVAEHRDDPRRLRTFRKPVLIITGTSTVPFHRRINEVLANLFPNVQRAELPGGHTAPLMSPDQFVELLEGFLNKRP